MMLPNEVIILSSPQTCVITATGCHDKMKNDKQVRCINYDHDKQMVGNNENNIHTCMINPVRLTKICSIINTTDIRTIYKFCSKRYVLHTSAFKHSLS